MRILKSVAVLAAGCVVLLSGGAVFAHHSFGHYDMTKAAEIEGRVSKFEWSNPHCWLFVEVAAKSGSPVTYGFELQSVGELLRRGWKKTTMKPGETVKIKFRPMRDGTPAGLLVTAERDGQLLGNFAGAPQATPPAR